MQKVQRLLLRRVRRSSKPIELPFRCDAPGLRREMKIRLEPSGPDGAIIFSARILHEETRSPQTLLEPEQPRGETLIEMCGWCDRFLLDGEWMEVEAAAGLLGLTTTASKLPRISHGLCPACHGMLARA